MDLLRKIAVEQSAAIIAVTHDEKIFSRFDRIFYMRDGQLEGETECSTPIANVAANVRPRLSS
jgi:putative ABC transport system ATP-binding protein